MVQHLMLWMMLVGMAGNGIPPQQPSEMATMFVLQVHVPYTRVLQCAPMPVHIQVRYVGRQQRELCDVGPVQVWVNGAPAEVICTPRWRKWPCGKWTPGEVLNIQGSLRCLVALWQPGEYVVEYRLPVGRTALRQGPFVIRVEAPAGVDREVFEAGRLRPEMRQGAEEFIDPRNPCGIPVRGIIDDKTIFIGIDNQSILQHYPTSRYAAWVIAQELGVLGHLDPSRAEASARTIAQRVWWWRENLSNVDQLNLGGKILTPEGWKSVYLGEWLRWRRAWAERIMTLHPDFPYVERVRWLWATEGLALGDDAAALAALEDLATHGKDSTVRARAAAFLHAWRTLTERAQR